MRMMLHTAALLAAVVLVTASAQPAIAATDDATWSPALESGSGAGVTVTGGAARIDPRTAFLAPPDPTGGQTAPAAPAYPAAAITPGTPSRTAGGRRGAAFANAQTPATQTPTTQTSTTQTSTTPTSTTPTSTTPAPTPQAPTPPPLDIVPTGLLTLPARSLPTATDHIVATVSAQVGGGAGATVDVRGLRSTGNWSEWIPADAGGLAVLPESSAQVQARLVLTGDPGPVVTAVTLAAGTPSRTEGTAAVGAPLSYSVYATREGLPGGTTANGHVIAAHDHFVALPSRRALSPDGKSDYSVRICAPNGRCVFAPVWDVGPWNTHDDYWNPATQREQWTDLPQGTPQAQAAYRNNYNGGNDQYNRHVVNPAGIDLGDGVFWDGLGLVTNTTVTVDYLWTGDVRLAKVVDTRPVLASPDPDAKVVGVAAGDAGVPVECTVGDWLRIGIGQYLAAAAVPDLGGDVNPC